MKKTLKFLCFALITSMCVIISSCERGSTINPDLNTWVDLGLPSGTLWKNQNEDGYYMYDEAISQFGDALPTKKQFEELINKCMWEWRGDGYKVTGPNGNSIILPAAGFRLNSGEVYGVGSGGRYWSSTPYGSKSAWYLYFYYGREYVIYDDRGFRHSVRLVSKSK